MSKEERKLLLVQIRRFKRYYDTGRNAFSNSYSEAHNELSKATDDLELFLEGHADKDELSEEEKKSLAVGLDEVRHAAQEYIIEKRDTDKYALESRGKVKKATGDKWIRLKAADELEKLCENNLRPMNGIEKEDQLLVQYGENRRRQAMNLDALTDDEKYTRNKRGAKSEMERSVKKFTDAREEYDRKLSGADLNRNEDYRHEMRKAFHYHRDSIMNFNTDEGFMKNYSKYRLDIYKAVEGYRKLEELRDSDREADQQKFQRELVSMGLSSKSFRKMSDKINELEMIGQYMDTRAELLRNPEYTKLNEKEERKLNKMSADDLQDRADQVNVAGDKKKMYDQMKTLKEMGAYGIKQKKEATRNEANYVKNRVEDRGVTTTFEFLTAYEDHGKKFEKDSGKADKLKSFLSAFSPSNLIKKKWKLTSSDGTAKVHDWRTGETKDKETATGLDFGMNVVKGKVRGLKFGGKYKSAGERFQCSTHASLVNARASMDVGASFSLSNLWEAKLYGVASAEASGLRVVSKMSLQTKNGRLKGDIKTESNVATASAKAQGGVGMIRYKDEEGKTVEGVGVSAELGANAAVYKGSVSGGVSIFGVRFGGKLTGQALGVGGTAKFAATSKNFSFGLGAALGLGAGFEVSIDWSGAVDKFRKWKERRAQRKALKEKLKADKENKKSAKKQPEEDGNEIDNEIKNKGSKKSFVL